MRFKVDGTGVLATRLKSREREFQDLTRLMTETGRRVSQKVNCTSAMDRAGHAKTAAHALRNSNLEK